MGFILKTSDLSYCCSVESLEIFTSNSRIKGDRKMKTHLNHSSDDQNIIQINMYSQYSVLVPKYLTNIVIFSLKFNLCFKISREKNIVYKFRFVKLISNHSNIVYLYGIKLQKYLYQHYWYHTLYV